MKNNKQSQDLVTIVTVTYNAEELLEETILSVINQSYKNIEYIIIDGESTDGTIDIIKKYEDKIDYWMSEPDDGIYFAMNKAIEKATGKWINFMNAGDTFFDLGTIDYVMQQKNNQAELIYGNFQIKENGVVRKAWDQSQWHFHMPFCHQTLFTLTSIMKKELFDISFRLAADHNFIMKMYEQKKVFFYIDKTLAIFGLGGFAESNNFLMRIESLKILLDHKVSQCEINQSYWYKMFYMDICSEKTNQIDDLKKEIKNKDEIIQIQEDQSKQLSALQDAIQRIIHYSIWRYPIKKYKKYKTMLVTYSKIKNSPEGDKVENK